MSFQDLCGPPMVALVGIVLILSAALDFDTWMSEREYLFISNAKRYKRMFQVKALVALFLITVALWGVYS